MVQTDIDKNESVVQFSLGRTKFLHFFFNLLLIRLEFLQNQCIIHILFSISTAFF